MGKNGNMPVSQTDVVLISLSTVMKTHTVTDESGQPSVGQSADSKSISQAAESCEFSGSIS